MIELILIHSKCWTELYLGNKPEMTGYVLACVCLHKSYSEKRLFVFESEHYFPLHGGLGAVARSTPGSAGPKANLNVCFPPSPRDVFYRQNQDKHSVH